jgi:hypothetical protein
LQGFFHFVHVVRPNVDAHAMERIGHVLIGDLNVATATWAMIDQHTQRQHQSRLNVVLHRGRVNDRVAKDQQLGREKLASAA